jgi:deoxyribonuclease V
MVRQAVDPAEAAYFSNLQKVLTNRKAALPKDVSRICAVDAAYRGDRVVAVASLFEGRILAEETHYSGTCTFPYVSGLFYLREGPFVVEAVRMLKARPQLVCFDAHGAAHPRFAGLATVGGMVLGIPSIGIAKSLLVGSIARSEGGLDTIELKGRTVGFVSEIGATRRYWSPGFSVGLKELKSVMDTHSRTCLRAMSEADRASRELMGRER